MSRPRTGWPLLTFWLSLQPHSLCSGTLAPRCPFHKPKRSHVLFPSPRPRQASFAPSLHLHFGSNAPSSSRSSGGLISRNHYCHLLAWALPVLHRLTPAYISIYVSVVFIFLESKPHESQFLVCVVHSSNTGPQSAGPSRHSRIRCW